MKIKEGKDMKDIYLVYAENMKNHEIYIGGAYHDEITAKERIAYLKEQFAVSCEGAVWKCKIIPDYMDEHFNSVMILNKD